MGIERSAKLRAIGGWLAAMALWAGIPALAIATGTKPVRDVARPKRAAAMSVSLVAARPYPLPPGFRGSARLLTHTMPAFNGGTTRATTLLFVPSGSPPAGGWPIVGWIHGTSSTGGRDCAPSLSAELDGGLTRDGFVSGYATELAMLVAAGYAVVAPDLEGLGPDGKAPYPYYIEASEPRSVISGIMAAREVDPALSNQWVVFGHSEGAHGALSTEAHAGEARGLHFLGTVAAAPYVSVAEIGREFADQARASTDFRKRLNANLMFNMQGMFMTTALLAEAPRYDARAVMGRDLRGLLPAFRTKCSVGAFNLVKAAVATSGVAFGGLKPGWASTQRMAAFLKANDQGEMPNYMPRMPTLIVQGGADVFVSPGANARFAERLRRKGAPVSYLVYPGADHFSVLPQADRDVLAFLKDRFGR